MGVMGESFNSSPPGQNGRHFADDIFKCIFLNENVWILIKISLKCIPDVWIINIPSLVQIMAWRRSGDKPLSEPVMVRLMTNICATLPQWVNSVNAKLSYSIFMRSTTLHLFTQLNLVVALLQHWGQDKMAAILQMMFSNVFSWTKYV